MCARWVLVNVQSSYSRRLGVAVRPLGFLVMAFGLQQLVQEMSAWARSQPAICVSLIVRSPGWTRFSTEDGVGLTAAVSLALSLKAPPASCVACVPVTLKSKSWSTSTGVVALTTLIFARWVLVNVQ